MPTPNNFRVKSGLTVGTTISGGNTTITGFVNATATVNASGLAVGTSFVANSTGAYHTGTINAASFTVGATVVANSTGVYASHLGGTAAAGYQTTAGLAANVATLTSNNSTYAFGKSEADLNVNNSTRATAANTVSVTSQSSNSTTFYPVFVAGTSTGTALGLDSALSYVPSTDTLSLGNIIVSGNLTVSGTTTYVNSTTLNVGDNIITLNADVGGAVAPTENAGIEINRGSSANVQFLWDETNDRWSTNSQPLAISSLVAAGAASGITTLAAGNTSITGFVNASASVNSAILAVGTSFIANTTGAYHTGTINAASHTVGTAFVANSTQTTYGQPVLFNNGQQLRFQTVNTSAYAYFTQQNDDNFVFYTSNTTYGSRAVFSVFANSVTSTFNFSVGAVFNGGIYANASYGTAGQLLTSNGTGVYWSSPGAASVNTAAQYTWTNTHVFSANVAFGNSIGIPTGNSTVSGGMIFFGGLADANWKMGRNTNGTTKWYYTNNTIDILAANSNLEGIVLGNSLVSGKSYFETGHAGTYIAGNVTIGNTTSNSTINSTAISIDQVISTNNGNGTNFKVGDDVWIGDINTSDTLSIRGQQSANNGYIVFGNADTTTKLGRAGTGALTYNGAFAAGNTTITGFANVAFGSGGGITGPGSGSWAGKIVTNQDTTAYNGLSVQNRWAAATSVIFEAAMGWNGTAVGYYPVFTVDGLGQVTINSNAPQAFVMGTYANGNVGFGNNAPAHKVSIAGTLAAGNTTHSGWVTASSARGAVATPTAGQNNSALYVTGSDTAYGLLFGTDPATGRGWIQSQRTDGTATTYALRLNPAGGVTEFGAGYNEAEVANTAATGTWTMDCSAANFFELTLTGSITISPSNVPASTRMWSGTIVAKQDATGGRTITWPTGIKWPGGSAPPATTTANAIDIWSLMTYDGGSTWVGSLTVKNVA